MGKAIGIDLGTTNCCVAVLEGGTVQIIPNKEGGRTTPTVVGFTEKGERLVGQIAKRQAVTNAANTVYAVKRLIGRKFSSPEVERMRATSAFEIVDSPNGDARVQVQGRSYSPPELSGGNQLKRHGILATGVALALLLAACGNSGSTD